MRLPRFDSIHARLMGLVLLTTAIALFVAGIGLLLTDLRNYRRSLAAELQTEAQILALSTAPALAFDDHSVAERNLESLQARPEMMAAAIYGPRNKLYAEYVRAGQAPPPGTLGAPLNPTHRSNGEVDLEFPVTQGGEHLGTIYLRAHYDVAAHVRAYVGILLLVGVLSAMVALLLSGKLQRSLSRPLEAITAVAREIIQRRDYSPRVLEKPGGEIGLVVEAFNKMLDEVHLRARTLQEEIAVRQAAEAALARANAALQDAMQVLRESDRKKDEFLAILAHELRNPLAPIGHAVKLLSLPSTLESQRVWGYEVIARQVNRMALLLDDLLDISRITRGRLELKKEYIELKALVASSVETARPLLEGRRHTLKVTLPAEPLALEVDPLRLSQALSNLLTNAAKYTDQGGTIELTVALLDSELVIAVRDNGIGLSAEALPRLFEMFSQVESAVGRSEGGLGIGLALVKGLITLHGGTVTVESGGLGQGSTFTIRLPRRCVLQPAEQAKGIGVPPVLPVSSGCKVLVADDNRDAADSLALLLRAAGHEVYVSYSGTDGWETALLRRPQVLLLDIGMPGMNGYEVARRVREQEWGRSALLVAATGWGQVEDRQQAKAAGFDAHMTKPVHPDRMLELIAAFVRSHASEDGQSQGPSARRSVVGRA